MTKLMITLPKVGSSNVREAGIYENCKLVEFSLVDDRTDVGESAKAKSDEFIPPWNDKTQQFYAKFETPDGLAVHDRLQLNAFMHNDPENPVTAESAKKIAEALKAQGIKLRAKDPIFKLTHRGTSYICYGTTDGQRNRVPSQENLQKSMFRLSGLFKELGVEIQNNVELEAQAICDAVNEQLDSLKPITIVLEEKVYDTATMGERRGKSVLFKVSYGTYKAGIKKTADVEETI